MDDNNPSPTVERSGSTDTLVAAIVILAILIVGAMYFWNQRADSDATNAALESISTQSNSDEAASIEADLESTDLENIDSELDESEFNAS